jgi:hypothetical protein
MANYTGYKIDSSIGFGAGALNYQPLTAYSLTSGGGTAGATTYYRMQARDLNAAPGVITWRTWVVEDEPDPTAAQYTTPYDGASKNFSTGTIAAKWTE